MSFINLLTMRSLLLLLILLTGTIVDHAFSQEDTMKYRNLTEAERRVIIHKGTERPYSGKYYDHFKEGAYTCKRCGAQLFKSEDKFSAHCGWPSFDDALDDAVKRVPDTDGRRTEIICSNCGAHLGHVFKGEGFTPKDTRHCVNSISLNFIPEDKQEGEEQ